MEKLNVAIADDNEKMLDLLGNLINEDKELELVGHANNGDEIYDIIKDKIHVVKFNREDIIYKGGVVIIPSY